MDRLTSLCIAVLAATCLILESCAKGRCKSKSTFSCLLENTAWNAEPEDCLLRNDDSYSIVVVEETEGNVPPDKLLFRHLDKAAGEKIFRTDEDVYGEPSAVFRVFEEFDGAIDNYYIVPDGESWLRIVSIDPESEEWTIQFHLKMAVDRPDGAHNVTYGDTITFSQGMMKAVFRKG